MTIKGGGLEGLQDEEGEELEEQDEKGGELEEDGEGDGVDADDNDNDNDCEGEEEVALDYDLVPGPLSQQDKEDAVKARAAYQVEIQAIARRGGKKVSAILKAIGDLPVSVCDSNPWNAHQVRYCAENPKPSGMSKEDYRAACKAAYLELFAHLLFVGGGDERPGAPRRCDDGADGMVSCNPSSGH
ncbi:hypothetical protein B0H14DRAFT_2711211 [Mycena olivaceomarginata]|nr:hypothetical protein B0H14DRAFT_2711211 [Mycena olivaceomarginata]